MPTQNRLFALTLSLILAISSLAQAQDVQDAINKTGKVAPKKTVKLKPVWKDAGTCHLRNSTYDVRESYMAKCKPNASRYANVIVNCGATGGQTVMVQVGQFRFPAYQAKRFECYPKSDSKRYRIGYDAGQSGMLTGNIAAEYACGCYTPPGGNECDAQGCRGRMQASLIIKESNMQLAQLMSQHGWQAWSTQWAALNIPSHIIGG